MVMIAVLQRSEPKLRGCRLDELPQVLDLISGDSGIIGTTKKKLDFYKGFAGLVEFCYDNFFFVLCRLSRGTNIKEWFLGCLF